MPDKKIVGIHNFSFFVEKFFRCYLKKLQFVEKLIPLVHFGYFSEMYANLAVCI